MKAATIGAGTKVPHLTYVGDAEVGEGSNIGCGVVFVNYDGVNKSRTVVGDAAFVGSNTMLVAPVSIGDGAYTSAGSVITDDVPAGALGIGRSRQVNKEGWTERRRPGPGRRRQPRQHGRASEGAAAMSSVIKAKSKRNLMLFSGRAAAGRRDQRRRPLRPFRSARAARRAVPVAHSIAPSHVTSARSWTRSRRRFARLSSS